MTLRLLAPTALEYWALRGVLGRVSSHRCGVGLDRSFPFSPGDLAVLCGLAGALTGDLPPGTVFIPDQVGDESGSFVDSDELANDALRTAARRLGLTCHGGMLLTASTLVTGQDRGRWEKEGFAAADMEAAILARRGLRVASVRVILDTPSRSIDPAWLSPRSVWGRPHLWPELLWLAVAAPRYALRAARIAAAALPDLQALA